MKPLKTERKVNRKQVKAIPQRSRSSLLRLLKLSGFFLSSLLLVQSHVGSPHRAIAQLSSAAPTVIVPSLNSGVQAPAAAVPSAQAAAQARSLTTLPDGYREGLKNAIYGTYLSPVSESARSYQDRLVALENKAYGIPQIKDVDPIKQQILQSEAVYLIEHAILRVHLDIANAPASVMTEFERNALLFSSVRSYQAVRHHGERTFEDMVRYIDVKLPGPNGLQIRQELDNTNCLYTCNYRTSEVLSAAEQKALYDKKLAEFQAEGGSLAEIHELTPAFAKTLKDYSRFEYVQLEDGRINVTPGSAGHILLAGGKPVKSAGQIVLIKAADGRFTMAIVSNASGSYKPDILNADAVAGDIAKILDIPNQRLVVTKGEPVSTQAVKIYLKGQGLDKAAIKAQVSSLDKDAKELLYPKSHGGGAGCGTVFGK